MPVPERPPLSKLYREARSTPLGLRALHERVKAEPGNARANLYLAKAIQWWHSFGRTGDYPAHPKARFFYERYKQLTEKKRTE